MEAEPHCLACLLHAFPHSVSCLLLQPQPIVTPTPGRQRPSEDSQS